MEEKQFTRNIRTDFNRLFCLVGVIPLLVFIYVLVNKISNINARVGEVGYIVMATIGVFVMGIIVGRKMLMSVTIKLIDDNRKILSMQQELLEKNRLAAITETVLALGDQINNPLSLARSSSHFCHQWGDILHIVPSLRDLFPFQSCPHLHQEVYRINSLGTQIYP